MANYRKPINTNDTNRIANKPQDANLSDMNPEDTQTFEEQDEQSMEGHQPASGSNLATDLGENLEDEGLYEENNANDLNGPVEVNIAEQIEKKNEG